MFQSQYNRDFTSVEMKQRAMQFVPAAGIPIGLSAIPTHGIVPRSAAEASLDSSSKFRQLPCKTFISVGTCPYGERCVFLHDPRCISNASHSITRLKNREDTLADSFFWPLVCCDHTARKSDCNFYPYTVPIPLDDQYRLHDQSLYSVWMHFVDFCRTSLKSQKSYNGKPLVCTSAPDIPTNLHINGKRLPVFQLLSSSNGRPINDQQFLGAYYKDVLHEVNSTPFVQNVARRNRKMHDNMVDRNIFRDAQISDKIMSAHFAAEDFTSGSESSHASRDLYHDTAPIPTLSNEHIPTLTTGFGVAVDDHSALTENSWYSSSVDEMDDEAGMVSSSEHKKGSFSRPVRQYVIEDPCKAKSALSTMQQQRVQHPVNGGNSINNTVSSKSLFSDELFNNNNNCVSMGAAIGPIGRSNCYRVPMMLADERK